MFPQIVEARASADQKFAVLERLDVKIDIPARRRRVAQNFLNDVGHGDDSFGAAEFVDDDRERLRMSQEKFQQIERAHRLRHERRREQCLGVMFGRIEEKPFHIDDANDVVRRVCVNWHTTKPFLL